MKVKCIRAYEPGDDDYMLGYPWGLTLKLLEKGKVYEVIHQEVGEWYTKYFLAEIRGTAFNSVWFETLPFEH